MRIAEQLAAGLVEPLAEASPDNETAIKFLKVVRGTMEAIMKELDLIEHDLKAGTINGSFVMQNLRYHSRNLLDYLTAVRNAGHNG